MSNVGHTFSLIELKIVHHAQCRQYVLINAIKNVSAITIYRQCSNVAILLLQNIIKYIYYIHSKSIILKADSSATKGRNSDSQQFCHTFKVCVFPAQLLIQSQSVISPAKLDNQP